MLNRRPALTAAFALAASTVLAAEDWPMWRGPAQNGVSSDKALPLTWTATENVTWKVAVPTVSGSTPIVSGNTVFLLSLIHISEPTRPY